MKTWDDWSDFEINCSMAIAQGCDVVVELSPSSSSVYCGYEGLESTQAERDYCNNPADIWPIIYNNEIQVTPSKSELSSAATFTNHGYVDKERYDKNPLRAAAIVFLMMNGVNPE